MSNNQKTVSGLSFGGALQVAFITLKLCHMIEWSWWWVLAPTWIPLVIGMLVCAVMLIVAALYK